MALDSRSRNGFSKAASGQENLLFPKTCISSITEGRRDVSVQICMREDNSKEIWTAIGLIRKKESLSHLFCIMYTLIKKRVISIHTA